MYRVLQMLSSLLLLGGVYYPWGFTIENSFLYVTDFGNTVGFVTLWAVACTLIVSPVYVIVDDLCLMEVCLNTLSGVAVLLTASYILLMMKGYTAPVFGIVASILGACMTIGLGFYGLQVCDLPIRQDQKERG